MSNSRPFCVTIVALAALAAAPVPSFAQRSVARVPIDSARRDTTTDRGAAVEFGGDTLFMLHGNLGPFTAAARASAVSARLKALARTGDLRSDTIVVVDREGNSELLVGGNVLMSVLSADTAGTGRGRLELARRWANVIAGKLADAKRASTPAALGIDVLFAFLASAVLAALLMLLRAVFPRVYSAAESVGRMAVPTGRWQALRIVPPARIAEALRDAARFARALLTVLLFYVYVPLVLSLFPATTDFSRRITGYAITPLAAAWSAFVAYVPNVFYIAVIVLITRYLLKAIRALFDAIEHGTITFDGFHADWAPPTYGIARVLVFAFAAVLVFPYLPGAQSDAFKGVSLFLGVLFSLGSSSAVGNVVAGILLTYTRAFQIGDRAKIGPTVGDITEKTLLVTRLRTIKNVEVTIPNATVLSAEILNYTSLAASRGLILHTTVTIGYDAPWRTVHALLIAAAGRTEYIRKDPAPFVLQTSLDDFYVSYQINAYTDRAELMAGIYSHLHENIQETFNEGGVEILSPHYSQLRDGNQSTIAADQLPGGYVAPTFRVTLGRDRTPPSDGE